ncbi:MAG: F0F1 ATP synthase subunit B [Candidatus Dormiibacterota bacterium]
MILASSPLSLNLTFIVEIVVFLVLLWLLARYVFPPLTRALDARQALIAQSLQEAERARQEAERARVSERQEMAEARVKAQEILDRAQQLGEQLRQELRTRGEQEQQAMLERARAELEREREQAVSELRRQVADLVLLATTRVLQEELDEGRQRQLVERALSEVDLSA